MIDRATWEPVASFALPVPEVYALVHLPNARERAARFDLRPIFSSFSASTTTHADEQGVTFSNDADDFLVASGAHDVVAGYRWVAADGTPLGDDSFGRWFVDVDPSFAWTVHVTVADDS